MKVELLPENEAGEVKSAAVKLEGPDGQGELVIKKEDNEDPNLNLVYVNGRIKTEEDRLDW